MAAYLQVVYDSHHLQADCQELGSAPEPHARQSTMGYLHLYKGNPCPVLPLGEPHALPVTPAWSVVGRQ